MNAEVTIKTIFRNVCSQEDLDDCKMTFREMVEFLIREDGMCSVVDNDAIIIDVKEIKNGK